MGARSMTMIGKLEIGAGDWGLRGLGFTWCWRAKYEVMEYFVNLVVWKVQRVFDWEVCSVVDGFDFEISAEGCEHELVAGGNELLVYASCGNLPCNIKDTGGLWVWGNGCWGL